MKISKPVCLISCLSARMSITPLTSKLRGSREIRISGEKDTFNGVLFVCPPPLPVTVLKQFAHPSSAIREMSRLTVFSSCLCGTLHYRHYFLCACLSIDIVLKTVIQ